MVVNKDGYVSDAPIQTPDHDVFKRWPFAQRVAQTIASRRDPSSIVIGLYGAWGEGKTSVLNFIEHELRQNPQIVCMKFNPWRFGDEDNLLKGFFTRLADSIDHSLSTTTEKIGDFINRFAKPVASAVGYGDAVDGLTALLNSADLDQLRERIENILVEQERRVVILVDDIDRLEKSEIQSIFRLVKLTADFKNTAYVLAFDYDMVSAALNERFGASQHHAGKAFLEKIVQVPLQLPMLNRETLRNYCFKAVDEALSLAEINLKNDEAQLFARQFVDGLECQLRTPRQAKLYGNILTFSLPILKGEINTVDLMLIEGVRVFYPELYDVIRQNTALFVAADGFNSRNDENKEKVKKLVADALKGFNTDTVKAAQELLEHLFPRLQAIYRNTHFGADWETSWSETKRICSKEYVARYFSYSIPENDVSDQEIQEFVLQLAELREEELSTRLTKLIHERNVDIVLRKLRQFVSRMSNEVSIMLSRILVKLSGMFPDTEAPLSLSSFSKAAMLIGDLVSNIQDSTSRIEFAKDLLQLASLPFGFECLRWFRRNKKERPDPRGFSEEEITTIASVYANRITSYEGGLSALFEKYERWIPALLYAWSTYGNRDETNKKLSEWINESPEHAIRLLICYLPTAWGLESGLSHKADFGRDQYNSVVKVVDAKVILNALETMFSESIHTEQYPQFDETEIQLKTAQQFFWLHKNQQKSEDSTETEEG
ncbi:KAP family P-loop NTPase fold protein [Paenibacillus sp. GYB003]|uniref:KAP family P-loop NTPase fold protein n=1 Tax=Paenibacillus sp. GYB003 TaxID=2994392 RepID=UPI002F9645C9